MVINISNINLSIWRGTVENSEKNMVVIINNKRRRGINGILFYYFLHLFASLQFIVRNDYF